MVQGHNANAQEQARTMFFLFLKRKAYLTDRSVWSIFHLVQSRDDLLGSELEAEGLSALARRVELRAVGEEARVVAHHNMSRGRVINTIPRCKDLNSHVLR